METQMEIAKKNEGDSDTNDLSLKKKPSLYDYVIGFISNSYVRFVVKKLLFYVLVFFIAITIAYVLPRALPQSPIDSYVIFDPQSETYEQFLERRDRIANYWGLGENQSFMTQLHNYFIFLGNLFQGDFGLSFSRKLTPVSELVGPKLIYSLVIVIPAVVVTFLLGNYIGGLIGFKQTKMNTILYYLFVFLQSAPFFWIALVFLDVITFRLNLVNYESPGMIESWADFTQAFKLFWLPFLSLVICFTGGWATGMRSMAVYELDSDYIEYSKTLGFRTKKLRRYANRNAILPQFTGLNLRFNEMLGATLVLERVFLWPGIGLLTYQSFTNNDYGLIIGCFIVTIMVVVIGNFIIDILYGFLDPRIRIGGDR